MRELDEFLSIHPQYKNRILESHPELAFARLKGSVVLTRKKEYTGLCERKNILQKYLPRKYLSGMWDKAKELGYNPDDLMDAACLAVTACLTAHGMCEIIPEKPEQDN